MTSTCTTQDGSAHDNMSFMRIICRRFLFCVSPLVLLLILGPRLLGFYSSESMDSVWFSNVSGGILVFSFMSWLWMALEIYSRGDFVFEKSEQRQFLRTSAKDGIIYFVSLFVLSLSGLCLLAAYRILFVL